MNKKGLLFIIIILAILLISLILILAFVKPLISDSDPSIDKNKELAASLEIVPGSVQIDESNNKITLSVKRDTGQGEIIAINVILQDTNNNEESITVDLKIAELEVKIIQLEYETLGSLKTISIGPIIKSRDEEIATGITDTYSVDDENIADIPDTCGNGVIDTNLGEVCDGNTQSCTTSDEIEGTQECNSQCSGYETCTTEELIPICNNDGTCNAGEDNDNCPADCPADPGDDPNENFVALSIGTITVTNNAYSCENEANPPEEFTCYDLLIACPEIPEIPMEVIVRVGSPLDTSRGTVTLGSGGGGQNFWGDRHGDISRDGVLRLRGLGFQTAELSFPDGWGEGFELGDGTARTGCRPATVFQWIHDTLHTPSEAFCSTGNSGGASQISTTISRYNFNEFDLAVITGGPPTARMDLGCIEEGDSSLWFPDTNAMSLDKAWGWPNPNLPEYTPGPCGIRDATWEQELQEASIIYETGRYFFDSDDIYISMMHGEDAEGNAEPQGLLYKDALEAAGTAVDFELVGEGTGHGVYSTEIGVDTIVTKIDEQCIVR